MEFRSLRKHIAAAVLGVHLLAGGVAVWPSVEESLFPSASAASPMTAIKTGPSTASPGQTIVYTVTIKNTGNFDVTGARLGDVVPAGLTFVPQQSTAGCAQQGTVVWCLPETYSPQESITYQLAFQVSPSIAIGTVIDNVADVWSANAEPNWSNHFYTTIVSGGNTNTTINPTNNVGVTSNIGTTAVNQTQAGQMQMNFGNGSPQQNLWVKPTANASTWSNINAGATNNTAVTTPGWGWGNTNTTVNPTSTVGVTSNIGTFAGNNTELGQQGMNFGNGSPQQNLWAQPTANASTWSTINAGAANNTAIGFPTW